MQQKQSSNSHVFSISISIPRKKFRTTCRLARRELQVPTRRDGRVTSAANLSSIGTEIKANC